MVNGIEHAPQTGAVRQSRADVGMCRLETQAKCAPDIALSGEIGSVRDPRGASRRHSVK